jgi:transcriptional regulator with XRE-family HTH domain
LAHVPLPRFDLATINYHTLTAEIHRMTDLDSSPGDTPSDPAAGFAAVTAAIARNVRAARLRHGWSLDRLSARSGVSKGMVVHIERASTNPSIATLSKLADALAVPLPELIVVGDGPAVRVVGAAEAVKLWDEPAGTATLLLGGLDPDPFEMWLFELRPAGRYPGTPHAAGVREVIHVTAGRVILEVDGTRHVLEAGTSAAYAGDLPHAYENPSEDSVEMFLVKIDRDPQ